MKKLIYLQENTLKKIVKKIFIIFIILTTVSTNSFAKEKWFIDKNISNIAFEVPVLFATNVLGQFENIDGYVEIDLKNKKNNKAVLSVDINSIQVNYKKYRNLILGPTFFDSSKFAIGVLDTKKFSYENENELYLNSELTIKGKSKMVETKLNINKLTNDMVQIIGFVEFSRTDFNIGLGNWSNTTILKDKIKINANIFLIKE